MKIVVLEPLGVAEEELREIAKPITDKGHELTIYNEKTPDVEVLKERVKDSDILIIANSPLKSEVIQAAENLKMISVAFTGFDHVDLDICKERQISVSNAAGYSTHSVAELAYGLMISLLRKTVPLDIVTRDGGTMEGYRQNDLYGKILGVVGTGAIGKKVANLGLAFGCDLIAYNRSQDEELVRQGVRYMDLDDVLKESDIVTIHLPLTDGTRGLISEEKLKLMKKDSLLINTARGPIIDNQALARGLNEGWIAGAGIDVFDMEPPIPSDYSLLNTKNIVLTPHIGFATEEAMVRRAHIAFANVDGWLQGNPQNQVL
ncbi:MAG TPA: 2-hydroxyacid dehydrogenase [Tissierellaceae bacterium]|nr:2-hydroxyacid dehydrogenase [Tissierellaceae bacterium]